MRLIRKMNGWFIAGICVALWLVYDHMVIPMPFISDWWKNSMEYRYQMRWDLESRHHLMGKTKAAVLSLLGPPDDTAGVHQEWLEYRTRNIPGTSVTRYDIRFENDKVVEFEGHSH